MLKIASQATVHRYLSNLVRGGIVEKSESVNDPPSVMLRLSVYAARASTTRFSRIIKHPGATQLHCPIREAAETERHNFFGWYWMKSLFIKYSWEHGIKEQSTSMTEQFIQNGVES